MLRALLRSREPLRVRLHVPRAGSRGRDATGSDVRLYLQECREAIRELFRNKRQTKVCPSSTLILEHASSLPRYYLRVTLARRMGEVVKERELWVHSYRMPPDSNMSIKMEVGIEDCLHIEFEYNKAK
jgi:hypothetical protein